MPLSAVSYVTFMLNTNRSSLWYESDLHHWLWARRRNWTQHTVLAPQKPVLPHITETTRISVLVGRRSVLLFQRFRFTIDDVQFLRRTQSQWCKSDSYQRLERLVFNIKVTYDTAERGIKILEDYKDVQTTDNEQRNMILHCVESIRQKYPDFRKKTLSCWKSALFYCIAVHIATRRWINYHMQYETTEQNFFLSIIEEIQYFQSQKSSLVQ